MSLHFVKREKGKKPKSKSLVQEEIVKKLVVNMRNEKFDVYIGRAGHGMDGYFGNPFEIGRDGDREMVIKKYKAWFWNRVNQDVEFRNRVMALNGKVLGCFCSPRSCHGDVIVSWLKAGCPLKGEK